MNPASPARSAGREPRDGATQAPTKTKQTPEADMQDEDAGTAASGTQAPGSIVQGAMKQTSKTPQEGGSHG